MPPIRSQHHNGLSGTTEAPTQWVSTDANRTTQSGNPLIAFRTHEIVDPAVAASHSDGNTGVHEFAVIPPSANVVKDLKRFMCRDLSVVNLMNSTADD